MGLQQLYDKAPVWVQNIMCSVQGWLICRRRYNKGFYAELEKFENGYYNQPQELVNMLYSIQQMSVYHSCLSEVDWKELNENPEKVYSVLARFPVIGKAQVKRDIDAFTNNNFTGEKIIMRTSGTTGSGLVFPYSVEMENKQWAIWWRYRRALGITQNTWCGWFGGKKIISTDNKKAPYWRINKPGKQVMYSSYHLTKDTVKLYYYDIKKRGLEWIHGYPSHIAKFASLILDSGLEPLMGLQWVTTGAENLVGNQLLLMHRAFPNAMIRQHYGLNEGVANISQNKDGVWHVDDDFCFVEFIPVCEDNPNVCRIIGTGFCNKVFPLVRYDTGDLATVEWNDDGTLKSIIKIDGRSGNTIKQPSGHELSEAALSIVLHDYNSITEAQFHQKSMSEIELWVVKGKSYSETDEKQLQNVLQKTFDKEVLCTIKYVNEVERTASGKLKIVISELTK